MINFSLNWWDYIALFSILFIGIPHGAFDGAISITLGYTKKLRLQLYFILTYILVSGVVIILWYFLPVITLILFILTSIFHFGCGDLDWNKGKFYFIGGYVHGCLIVLGIIFLNKIEVNSFFEILSGDQLSLLWTSLYLGLFFWIIAITYICLNYSRINISNNYIKLALSISLLVLLLPPLPAFAIYFCLIHSFHHIRRTLPILVDFMEKQKAIFLMIIFSILSWVGCGIAFYYLSNLNTYPDTIIKVTFIGLAALTFPHMILVDGIFRSKFKI